MRECRHLFNDIDPQLEAAARAKQRLDAERWRDELRPGAMRLFAARTAKLPWSRGLLNALVEELYPDDLFTELVGNLDRVPRRQWPHVLAIAVALRHSWATRWSRADRETVAHLTRHEPIARPIARTSPPTITTRFSGSPRPRQGAPLRFAPATRGWRP